MRLPAWLLGVLLTTAAPAWASGQLRLEPAGVLLEGPRARVRVLVTLDEGGRRRDVTARARVRIDPPLAVAGPGGILAPRRDGRARLAVTLPGSVARPAAGSLVVRASAAPKPVSFVNEVVPVLTQLGCNQGVCHGAQHGKGGFRLSLLGDDPKWDYAAIAREAGGRRLQRSRPSRSLLLRKPLLEVPHAGGRRLDPRSDEMALLAEWLAQGAPGPAAGERGVTRLAVQPPERRLERGAAQALRVTAVYSDGSAEDVTHRARFNTSSDGVARVSETGLATAVGPGEAAVMVRFQGQVAVARLAVPFPGGGPVAASAGGSFIDREIEAGWRRLGLAPSAPCSDQEFLRRVYLDLAGRLPTPAEARAFLAPGGADGPRAAESRAARREQLVDHLLQQPEWVDVWTLYFGDILRNSRELVGEKGMWALRGWLRESLRSGKPYNRMVRELIDVRGSTYRNPAANYYSVARTPEDLAETTSQVFLGVRLQCARCHNHPFERWTQDDYYRFAAYFARVRYKGFPDIAAFGGDQLVLQEPSGEVTHPRTGRPMAPRPLASSAPPPDEGDGRRRLAALAAWLEDPANPFVARNLVNRVWARLLGVGLVEPVDDVRTSNPASHPALLDALARDFAEQGFDLRRLMRRIVLSRAYQLSSAPTRQNAADTRFYSRFYVRRPSAEVLLDMVADVTGVPEKFPSLPAGTRAVQLPDASIRHAFLQTFGKPPRTVACECERDNEPNLPQVLTLMNGEFLQARLSAPAGRLRGLLDAGRDDAGIIEELYWAALGRPPLPDEQREGLEAVRRAAGRQQGLEDVLWALLNTKEFLLQH